MAAPACPWRLRAGAIDVDCLLAADEDHGSDHWHRSDDGWSVQWTDHTDGAYRHPLSGIDRDLYVRLVNTLCQLGPILQATRARRRLNGRQAAAEIGVAPSTISRVERGTGGASLAAAIAILRWIGAP
jgi:DNA-binding XRE family transcriptional regulator